MSVWLYFFHVFTNLWALICLLQIKLWAAVLWTFLSRHLSNDKTVRTWQPDATFWKQHVADRCQICRWSSAGQCCSTVWHRLWVVRDHRESTWSPQCKTFAVIGVAHMTVLSRPKGDVIELYSNVFILDSFCIYDILRFVKWNLLQIPAPWAQLWNGAIQT